MRRGDGFRRLQMLPQRRQRGLGERLCIGVLTGGNFLLEQCDGLPVRFDLRADERLVVRITGEHVEFCLFRHLAHARRARQRDVLRSGEGLQFVIGRSVVLDQHRAKILDLLIVAALLGLIAGVDLEQSTLRSLFVKRRIGIIRSEREGCEGKRSDQGRQRQYSFHRSSPQIWCWAPLQPRFCTSSLCAKIIRNIPDQVMRAGPPIRVGQRPRAAAGLARRGRVVRGLAASENGRARAE